MAWLGICAPMPPFPVGRHYILIKGAPLQMWTFAHIFIVLYTASQRAYFKLKTYSFTHIYHSPIKSYVWKSVIFFCNCKIKINKKCNLAPPSAYAVIGSCQVRLCQGLALIARVHCAMEDKESEERQGIKLSAIVKNSLAVICTGSFSVLRTFSLSPQEALSKTNYFCSSRTDVGLTFYLQQKKRQCT